MRIAHLIAHAESVPHYVPSLSRRPLCNKRKILSKEKPVFKQQWQSEVMGEGNMKQNRGGWEKSVNVLAEFSDNTKKPLKIIFYMQVEKLFNTTKQTREV